MTAGDANAEDAAGQTEHQDLREIQREHRRRRGANAFQDGDALHLLLDEDARHARHADTAENQHDQTDQAQVVLGALEIFADVVLDLPVAADAHELVGEVVRQRLGDLCR